MDIISNDEFNKLILKYTDDDRLKILLEPVKQIICNMDILQVIANDLYIQSAFCQGIFMGQEEIVLDIPIILFKHENFAAVFEEVTVLAAYGGRYSVKVCRPYKEALKFFDDDNNMSILHPLIKKSLIHYREYGMIYCNAQTIFMRYDLNDSFISDGYTDLFLDTLNLCSGIGYIDMLAYISQSDLIGSGLLPVYKEYFDELVVVGAISNNEFISHTIIGFYNKK